MINGPLIARGQDNRPWGIQSHIFTFARSARVQLVVC